MENIFKMRQITVDITPETLDIVMRVEPEHVCVNREVDVVKHEEKKVVQEGNC